MRTLFLLCILVCGSFQGIGQSMNWTPFEHLNDSLRKQQKPLLLFFEAEWCKYCKMQEQTTFSNPKVLDALDNYYALKIDGEQADSIPFLNRIYQLNPSTGYNELASMLATYEGQVIFPTTVLFDNQQQLTALLYGLQSSRSLMKELKDNQLTNN